MLRFVATVFVVCAPVFATQYHNHGADFSKWAMASEAAYAHAPVGHADPHAYAPVAHGAAYGPKTVHVPSTIAHPSHVPGKALYKEEVYVKEHHHRPEHKHLTVKYHDDPIHAYVDHLKYRSVTFTLPLFTAKNAPIITLTNKFPKEW